MTKINLIHTPCRNCVFATYQENTQNGCLTNFLELFKKNNVEIIEAYDATLNFFVINGKKCISYRDKNWLDKKGVASAEEAIDIVTEENQIKYISIIILEQETSIDNVKDIILSQKQQSIPPKGIMIIREMYNEYNLDIKELSGFLKEISIPWRMQNFINKSMSFDDRLRSIIKSAPMDRYYYLIYPSKYENTNFAEKINKYVTDGKAFGCININDNLFFSYLSMQYAKNISNIDILKDIQGQIKYETIN